MASTNIKKLKKVKKSGWIGSVIAFFVFTILFAIGLVLGALALGTYVLESKISTEYEAIEYMAGIYEKGLKSGDDRVFDFLDEEGRAYIIRDKDGNVIHQNGENTCSFEGEKVKMSRYKYKIMVYRDSEKDYIYPENGELNLDFGEINDGINEENYAADDDEADEDIDDEDFFNIEEKDVKMLGMPLWISLDINNSQQEFIAKADYRLNIHDLYLIIGIVIAFLVVVAVIFVMMFVKIIRGIIRQKRIMDLFYTDDVTQGNNWMYFIIKGEQQLKKRRNKDVGFAIVNLSFVNYRNYCVCHSVKRGEEMLRRVYDTISSKLDKNEICAHVTVEEFALMLRYEDEEALRVRLHGIVNGLENIDMNHKFGFHVGVELIDKSVDDKGLVVKRKDIDIEKEYNYACAACVSIGESDESEVVFFDDKLVEEQRWIDKVQERQSQALANEEFLVYYQPKYDPKTNELRGAEALIRWNSPEFGLVSPGRFIPIFEKNGFITEIDHYMIQHVAHDQKMWLDKGIQCVPISVNVSRAHFIESDLAEQIRDMVDAEGTPHELVEIELTESAFFDDKNAMIKTIDKLKGYGFAVSMDDFGSGYSSLNSLKDMPLDVLKLDADFFRGDTEDERGEIVVSEAIKLAKHLNMRTVAEGVEIRKQVDFLASQGCDMIQGFYFAKPMPRDEFEKKYEAGKAEIDDVNVDSEKQ